jgi:penicillin amidase
MPVLAGLSDLSVASSGDFYTLDRGGSFDPPDDQPFARQHGGGYRAIYDLANPDQSRFMITTGESGHIFSPHYGDLVHLWNDVKYITLSGTKEEMEGRNASLLELTP